MYVLDLAEEQYKTLRDIGSFKDLDIKVSVGPDKRHTVVMNKEDYMVFLGRHCHTFSSDKELEKQFNVSIDPESKYHQLRPDSPLGLLAA